MAQYGDDQFWGNTYNDSQQFPDYGNSTAFFDTSVQQFGNLCDVLQKTTKISTFVCFTDFQQFDQPSQAGYSYTEAPTQPLIFTPDPVFEGGQAGSAAGTSEFDERPLLDELEIYPERIWEKSLAVLNPFHGNGLSDNPAYLFQESDLAGPISFCLAMAVCLFVSGSKANFGYIYGLCIISVILMYSLISLMTTAAENFVSLTGVASILGYSILPIVWLSIVGIVFPLNSGIGMILTGLSIVLATAASSRIFCLMTGDPYQRFLIAYPCMLVYVIFSLLVLF